MNKAAWLFVALTVAAIIVVIFARGEILGVVRLFRHARVTWLLVAFGLQVLTYVLAAGVWHIALQRTPYRQPLSKLIGLALAMLFSNQAMPSVGISGGLVVVSALVKRGVPETVAMSALLLGLITTYIALCASFIVAAVWASQFQWLFSLVLAAGVLFFLVAAAVSSAVFASKRLPEKWKRRLTRMPFVGTAARQVMTASTELIRGPALSEATVLQAIEILLDAATLAVALRAIGSPAPALVVFGSYVVAEVGSRVAIVPLGLGTFEATCVALLHAGRVPFHAALAGTLLLRGFTLWLPMVPGLFTAKRALEVQT